jgi:hypothetical protein
MNITMLPHYGISRLAGKLREFAEAIERKADLLEASRRLTPAQRVVLQRNAVFANKHKGQPAFVIVNGPSLAKQDILQLKDQITFCVSGFWKHEAVATWQPTYYSMLDPYFFSNIDATQTFYRNLNERIQTSTFFLPLFRGYDAIHKHNFLPSERCHFVASVGAGESVCDFTKIVQSFAGVSAFALSQAIYMGCSPIYLLGFDHDYLANRGVNSHFYAGGTLPGHPLNDVAQEARWGYDDEMRANLRLWTNYRRLKAEAERRGIQVFNATVGGYLDVFDRFDYDKLKID